MNFDNQTYWSLSLSASSGTRKHLDDSNSGTCVVENFASFLEELVLGAFKAMVSKLHGGGTWRRLRVKDLTSYESSHFLFEVEYNWLIDM